MARHGLRVTEAIDLRWDQIDFSKGHLHVRRLKGGIHSVHLIQADELRNLRELKREQDPESALENLHDLDIGLGTPVIFSRSDHQGVHKVWGTQLDEAGHYQSIDLQ
jgi:integrase